MAVTINSKRKGVEISWEPGDSDDTVTVYAQGSGGEWHNTSEMSNDGVALVSYPVEFVGESLVEVRDESGEVIDSGVIVIK